MPASQPAMLINTITPTPIPATTSIHRAGRRHHPTRASANRPVCTTTSGSQRSCTPTGTLAGTLLPTVGVGTYVYDLPLREGTQRIMLDPAGAPDENLRCELRLFFLEGVVDLAPISAPLMRAGRPLAPAPGATIGAPARNAAGANSMP